MFNTTPLKNESTETRMQ